MKLAILLDYMHLRMLCLALPPCRIVQKLDFQSEFSMSKIIRNFLIFFSLTNWLSTFFVNWFFGNFNSKTTFLPKPGRIFDKVAKHLWTLIIGEDDFLQDLLKNRIADSVASEVNDSNLHLTRWEYPSINYLVYDARKIRFHPRGKESQEKP